ncbi:hypothetical protein HAX54_017988, partial [Datura stramonium]|nr:hypothetical protein [Datura stramonium]
MGHLMLKPQFMDEPWEERREKRTVDGGDEMKRNSQGSEESFSSCIESMLEVEVER